MVKLEYVGGSSPSLRSADRHGYEAPSRCRPSDERVGRAAAGEVAGRDGTGLVALRGPVDDLARLVDRSAAAARLEPGDGRVPGDGHAVPEPGAQDADELAGRGHQRVAVAAVAPGQAPRRPKPS